MMHLRIQVGNGVQAGFDDATQSSAREQQAELELNGMPSGPTSERSALRR